MAQGLFNLKQVNQALNQSAWSSASASSTYAGTFNGLTQYLNTTSVTIGTGNFTFEAWCLFNPNGATYGRVGGVGDMYNTSGFGVNFNASTLRLEVTSNNSTIINPTQVISYGTWNHIALVRSGSTVTLYINGVSGGTATNSSSLSGSIYLSAVLYLATIYYGAGEISNARLTNTAVYTTAFTPPVSPLTNISGTTLLTLQNATIIDNSSSPLTITNTGTVATSLDYGVFNSTLKTPTVEYLAVAGGGGGGRYNGGGGGGAGGLLTGIAPVVAGTSYTVTVGGGGAGGTNSGTGQGISGDNSVFGSMVAVGGGGGGGSDVPSPPTYNYGLSGGSGGGSGTNGAGYWPAGQGTFGQGNAGGRGNSDAASWRHGGGGGGAGCAGRDQIGTSSGSAGFGGTGLASAISGTTTVYAGGGGGGAFYGAIGLGGSGGGGNGGNVDATIPPTSGTANTGGGGGGTGGNAGGAGTVAGSGGSGAVVISYPDTFGAAASVTGAPTISTSGSGSLSFNGSSQYITYASNVAWALGSTFTLEFWTYPTAFSTGSNKRFFDTSNNGAGGFSLRTTGTGLVALDVTATGQTDIGLPLNMWTHVAVVVTSGTLAIYFNGVAQSLSGGGLTGINVTGTLGLTVGNFGTASTYAYQGYLSNVRIVKGVAVYTGNFTPSIVPLQATQSAGTNIAAITSTSTGLLLNSVSGASLADASTNSFSPNNAISISPAWNSLSPFSVVGYKNRVYRWTSSGTITF